LKGHQIASQEKSKPTIIHNFSEFYGRGSCVSLYLGTGSADYILKRDFLAPLVTDWVFKYCRVRIHHPSGAQAQTTP
jgi:hypothetical protein